MAKILLFIGGLLVVLVVAWVIIYAVFLKNNIDWTQGSLVRNWKTYQNSQYGFSFKYPPNLSIKSEDVSKSYIKDARLLLSAFIDDEIWGIVYVIPKSHILEDSPSKFEVPFPNNSQYKLVVKVALLITDTGKKKQLKEKTFDHLISTVKFE